MLPMGRYKGCRRNFSKIPGVIETDGCTLYFPQDDNPVFCSRCGCNIMYHRVPETGEAGGSAPCDICGTTVPRETLIVETEAIPVPIPDEPVVARGAPLKPRFTTAQNVAMRNLAQCLGWSIAAVSGLPNHQADIDNVCKEIDVTRKQFRDWVSKNKPCGVSRGQSSN